MLKLLLALVLTATLSARNIIHIATEDTLGLVTITTEDYVILPPNHSMEHNVFFNPKDYIVCSNDECELIYIAKITRQYKTNGINYIYIGDYNNETNHRKRLTARKILQRYSSKTPSAQK